MRKGADLILIALVLGGFAVGVYAIGRAVTHESETAAERSTGETLGASTSTTTATTSSKADRDTRDLQILVAKIVGAGLVVLALLATVNALLRSSRLERWER
jgi:hypothetical protein